MVTENSPQFVSSELESFLADRDINHFRSSVYYHQAIKQMEKQTYFNSFIWLQIAIIKRKPWEALVTEFLHTYRATPHAVTATSPSKLLQTQTILKEDIQNKQEKTKQYTDQRYVAKPSTFVCIQEPRIIAKSFLIPPTFPNDFPRLALPSTACQMEKCGCHPPYIKANSYKRGMCGCYTMY